MRSLWILPWQVEVAIWHLYLGLMPPMVSSCLEEDDPCWRWMPGRYCCASSRLRARQHLGRCCYARRLHPGRRLSSKGARDEKRLPSCPVALVALEALVCVRCPYYFCRLVSYHLDEAVVVEESVYFCPHF